MDDPSKSSALVPVTASTPTKTTGSTNDVDVFRKPFPPDATPSSRRQKRKILEEEKFVQDLGHIIERDFFPDIKRLRAKEKYLAALEKNDVVTLRELYAKYKIHRGPSPSPSTMGLRDTPSSSFETPIHHGHETPQSTQDEKADRVGASEKRGSIDEEDEDFDKKSVSSTATSNRKKIRDLRLDQYLALNTSEDNVSFEKIMEETEKRERAKTHQSWLYEQQALTNSSSERPHELPVPSIEQQVQTNNPDAIEFWPYTVKNAVMYYPDGAKLTVAEKIEQAKHVRTIHHGSTRFENDPFTISTDSSSRGSTPARPNALTRPQIDIDGREIKGLESPKVGGYGYMVTPSPMPGAHGDESPMMTWGEIEGTPFCLDPGNETPRVSQGGPSFKIIETPFRERLALELVEKNAAQHRQKKIEAMKTINRNFGSIATNKQNKESIVSGMSPAAQRLLSNRLGIQRSQSTNSQRHSVLTPSPIVRDSATTGDRTPRTPVDLGIIKHSPRTPVTSSTSNLTDNLLNLKR